MANGLRAARAARGGQPAREESAAERVARVRRETARDNRSEATGGRARHATRGGAGHPPPGSSHQEIAAARTTATHSTDRPSLSTRRSAPSEDALRRPTIKDRFQQAVASGPNTALRRELFEHRAKKALSDHAEKAKTEFRSAFMAHEDTPSLTRGSDAETREASASLTRTFYDDARTAKPRSFFDPHSGATRDSGGTDFIGALNLETGNMHTGNIHVETPGNKKVLSGTDVIKARASAERTLAKQRAEGTAESAPTEFEAPDVRSQSVSLVVNSNTKPVMELATSGRAITDPNSDLFKGETRAPAETQHYKRALRALGTIEPKEVFARHTEIGGMMRKTVGDNAQFSATNFMGEQSRTFTGSGTVYRAKHR